jgi:hypothetical protein
MNSGSDGYIDRHIPAAGKSTDLEERREWKGVI